MYTPFLRYRSVWIGLLTLILFFFVGCDSYSSDEDEEPEAQSAVVEDVFHISDFIATADSTAPTQPSTYLYERRAYQPITTPEGTPVTLAMFNQPDGTARMTCVDGGTRVEVELTGLIPNGTYTLWADLFNAPGYDPTYAYEVGVGPFGPQDGSTNAFTASADGTASLETTLPAGPLSMLGEAGACLLTDSYEAQVTAAYHINGQTYGPDLGPDGTAVEQFSFVFMSAQQ